MAMEAGLTDNNLGGTRTTDGGDMTAVNYLCPYCGKLAISMWQKLRLGPIGSARCKECTNKVCIPWTSLLLPVPFLALISVEEWGLALLWVPIGSFIHLRWIPLLHERPTRRWR